MYENLVKQKWLFPPPPPAHNVSNALVVCMCLVKKVETFLYDLLFRRLKHFFF